MQSPLTAQIILTESPFNETNALRKAISETPETDRLTTARLKSCHRLNPAAKIFVPKTDVFSKENRSAEYGRGRKWIETLRGKQFIGEVFIHGGKLVKSLRVR